MAVVLPAPLGPMNPNVCPSARVNDRPSRATRSPSWAGQPRQFQHVVLLTPVRTRMSGVLARTLAAGPVGGVRPGEEPGVLLGSYRVGLGRDCAGPLTGLRLSIAAPDAGDEEVLAGLVVMNRGSPSPAGATVCAGW
jgi:hypothetical protein